MFDHMKLLFILGCIAFVTSSDVPKNDTSEAKTKRGIYHLSDPSYSLLPVHHLARYTQERSLTDDASQISITYRPQEEAKPQHDVFQQQQQQQQQPYDYGDAVKVSSNNHYKVNEPSHLTHFPTYAASQYSNPIAQQTARTHEHLAVPPQHLVAPQYSYLNQKISTPIPFYGADKHLALPANIRTTSEIKLPEYLESYTTIPIIYGQPNGHLPSLKYIQPLPKAQYNLPPPTAYNPLQLTNTYQPFKVSAKLNVAAPHQQPRVLNNFKPFQPNLYQPQVFDNPVVPQLQHYIPPIQSPFDAFTKPAPLPVQAKPPPPPPKKEQSSDEEEDDDEDSDDDDERDHKEVRDEDEFDRGYDEASRGFPAYDEDDDHRPARYRHDDEDKYERFRARYQAERDEDDDHKGHYSTKRERSRKLRDYDDDKKGRHDDRDHEGRHSHKSSKKEPKNKYHKAKSSYEASKYYKGDDNGRKKEYTKYYKSKKPQPDSRHIGSSLKKQTAKKPSSAKESASSRSEVELQYGFEPIKVPQEEVDSVARHSEPNHNRKLYKENWFYSKTSKSQ